MALELKQGLRLSQQLRMTPQLQQAIKLLQLSRLELEQTITKEMEENPILEEAGEVAEDEAAGKFREPFDAETHFQRARAYEMLPSRLPLGDQARWVFD